MPAIETRAVNVVPAKGRLPPVRYGIRACGSGGTTIGGGLLRIPREIAAYLPNTAWYIGIWLFGGVSILLGATVYAELGAMLPTAGGSYVFVRRAFGDYAGFIVGLVDWLTDPLHLYCGTEYSYRRVQCRGCAGVPWPCWLVACGVIGVLALLHWHSVRWGGADTDPQYGGQAGRAGRACGGSAVVATSNRCSGAAADAAWFDSAGGPGTGNAGRDLYLQWLPISHFLW